MADVSSRDFEYRRITPTADGLPATNLAAQFEHLHGALTSPVEVLLVATDDEITYYVGTTPRQLPTVEQALHRILPEGYAFEAAEAPLPDLTPRVAAELHGVGHRHEDWMTRLRPPALSDAPEQHETARMQAAPGLPLESVIEGMVDADGPVVYQALVRPKDSWGYAADRRIRELEQGRDTYSQKFVTALFGPTDGDDDTHTRAHERGDVGSVPGNRIDAILAKSTDHAFGVNTRLLAGGPDAEHTVEQLASAFEPVGGDFYAVRPVVHDDPDTLHDAVERRAFRAADGTLAELKRRIPFTANSSPEIVTDPTTVAHACLFDASELSDRARRAMHALPSDRTGLALPDDEKLAHYDRGLSIGDPITANTTALDDPVALPPDLQPLHVAWFGKTGSGKTTSLINAILENQQVTDGADVIVDPKGDGMPREYLRAHYAEHGDLDGVYYFDLAETLPAISFLDIRPQLAAGLSRTTAVENLADHYIEILRALKGEERFDQAVRSPDVIRYLVKAMFDSEHGADAIAHRELYRTARKFRESGTVPQLADAQLESLLANVAAGDQQSFDRVMQGVFSRIEEIPADDRLARLFNHVRREESDPHFDFGDVVDEDAVVILDLGGLRQASREALTLVLLSNLWTALQRRQRQSDEDADLPLVNLYLEEAATVANTDLLSELLSQSRSFGLSVTLAMQFPAQLASTDSEAYAELMNNVSTVVTGNVPVDDRLTQRLATADMSPEDVGNRLRSLQRGQWLIDLPAPFDEPEPRPFMVESLDLPSGHPEGDATLGQARQAGFDALFEVTAERSWRDHGIRLAEASRSVDADTDDEREHGAKEDEAPQPERAQSALPYTDRMPEPVHYDADRDALVCETCDARYPADAEGMEQAIVCHADRSTVDREDVPICDVPLTISTEERAASPYTGRQLLFVQAVYRAQQQRFTDLEFDLVHDSMTLLRDYLDIEHAAVQELVDDGLLTHDGDRPHRLYSVTAEGREAIQVTHREGIAHGDGAGDMAESSLHRLMVEVGARLLEQRYTDDTDSAAVAVRRYHEPEDFDHRLDAAALDEQGAVVAALEAERINNDVAEAALADYEKLAAHDPEAAIWITETNGAAHDLLEALNDPGEGEPRVETTYGRRTRALEFNLDAPGCTDILTAGYVRDTLLASDDR